MAEAEKPSQMRHPCRMLHLLLQILNVHTPHLLFIFMQPGLMAGPYPGGGVAMRGPTPQATMFNPGQLGPYSNLQQMGGGGGAGPSGPMNGGASTQMFVNHFTLCILSACHLAHLAQVRMHVGT